MSEQSIKDSHIAGAEITNGASDSAQTAENSTGSTSTTMPQLKTPAALALKPSTLYAVLLHGSDSGSSWHWVLFLPFDCSPSETSFNASTPISLSGTVWHVTNANPRGRWVYEELTPDAIGLSSRLILTARLADLSTLGSPPDVSQALSQLLACVPVRAEAHKSVFNCLTWMLDGIGELDDGGFLSCVSTMALERELIAAAQLASPKYEHDGSYVLITPRNCSDN
ncbi:hypothetical protein ACEPAH_9579 [Sanghuangporus vaninii]